MIESNVGRNLEQLMDSNGLAAVLDALSEICYAKAAHIEEAWQDDRLAKHWRDAGRELERSELRVVKIDYASLGVRP